jgi:electron transport complex protein RnfG
VYELTKAPIEAAKKAKKEQAIKEVLPAFDSMEAEMLVKVDGYADSLKVTKAKKNNVFVGAAVETYSMNAFSGQIKVMVGFDAEGKIVNYAVLEQKETPGLGTKMVDWFKTDKGNQDIRGKHPVMNNLSVSKDGGEVDAITASTISSRAFLESVRLAYDAYLQTANNDSTKQQ